MLLVAGAPVLLGLFVRIGNAGRAEPPRAVARGAPRLERDAARRARLRHGGARRGAGRRDGGPHPHEADPALDDRRAEARRRGRPDRRASSSSRRSCPGVLIGGPGQHELRITSAFAVGGRDRLVRLRGDLPRPERGDEPRADHRAGVRAALGGPARRRAAGDPAAERPRVHPRASSRRSRRRARCRRSSAAHGFLFAAIAIVVVTASRVAAARSSADRHERPRSRPE